MVRQRSQTGGEMSPKKKAAAERAERLVRQLRDNLQKRKAQARARKAVANADKA